MRCRPEMMRLYAVTDRAWTKKKSLIEQVEAAICGGATCIQLREKNLDEEAFLREMCIRDRDTGRKSYTCIGAVFEVGKNDMDLKRFRFFSHAGKIPEDEYVTVSGIPYSIAQIQKLVHEREQSEDCLLYTSIM